MRLNSVAFLASATVAGPPPGGSIIETLLAASTFGFVISPNDPDVTLCYTETTGLSATTLCTNSQDIGTIKCVVTNRVITFPSGTKPVFRDNGTRKWIDTTSSTAKILWSAVSAYTGSDAMLMFMSGVRASEVSGSAPVLASATKDDGPFWASSTTGGLQQAGLSLAMVRDGAGGSIPTVDIADAERFAAVCAFGSTSDPYSVREGAGTFTSAFSHSAIGAWDVNQAYLGTSDETAKFEGEICTVGVLNVTSADMPALVAEVRGYAEANAGL